MRETPQLVNFKFRHSLQIDKKKFKMNYLFNKFLKYKREFFELGKGNSSRMKTTLSTNPISR